MHPSPTFRGLRTEVRLLLRAARVDRAESPPSAVPALLDWSLLLALAEYERATSIVWKKLLSGQEPLMPRPIAESFRRLSMLTDFRSLTLEERCQGMLAAARDNGIEVMLLKGAALASTTYRGFVDRPMGDLDILVSPRDAERTWRLAQQLGWHWPEAEYPLARYAQHHHLPPLIDGTGGSIRLEIHTALGLARHPFSLSFEDALRRAEPLDLPVGRVRVLDPDHQLVHVCVHFAWAHLMLFGSWRALRDANALAASGRLQWDRVVRIARDQHAASSVYWTLRMAQDLTGLEVPSEALRDLSAQTPAALRKATARHLVAQMFPTGAMCPSERLLRALWSRAMAPERQGIGAERPWDGDEVAVGQHVAPPSAASRLARQISNFRSWWRYLAAVTSPT